MQLVASPKSIPQHAILNAYKSDAAKSGGPMPITL